MLLNLVAYDVRSLELGVRSKSRDLYDNHIENFLVLPLQTR